MAQADKVHFCAQNVLCQHLPAAEGAFGKPFMVQMGPFWLLFAVLWLQKVPKTAVQTPQNQPKMRQNHPKMGFEGILDRLEAISIPSVSISKGIQNKKFRPISGPQVRTPLGVLRLPVTIPPTQFEFEFDRKWVSSGGSPNSVDAEFRVRGGGKFCRFCV